MLTCIEFAAFWTKQNTQNFTFVTYITKNHFCHKCCKFYDQQGMTIIRIRWERHQRNFFSSHELQHWIYNFFSWIEFQRKLRLSITFESEASLRWGPWRNMRNRAQTKMIHLQLVSRYSDHSFENSFLILLIQLSLLIPGTPNSRIS